MSHVGAPSGRTCSRSPRSRAARSVALLTGGAIAVSLLAGCSSAEEDGGSVATAVPQDIAPAARPEIADGGTLRWAVDAMPATLNAFQADADATTARITGAVLPHLFTLDDRGRPQPNPDYLESAEVVEREPKQVVLYKLHQQAVWSDGREIGAPDFVAQWRALSGRDSAYWTARNAGYERIEKIERGGDDLAVRVTFNKPYADWRALFSPLYPKEVMGTPDGFNDSARTELKRTAGPFQLGGIDTGEGTATLVRNPRWWGQQAKLDSLVLRAVPREERAAALAAGTVDLAEIDRAAADRIALAVRDAGANGPAAHRRPLAHGPGSAITPSSALKSWALAHGSDEEQAELVRAMRKKNQQAIAAYATEQNALRGLVVRKSLEPVYTQLALNGESGPLADERVRRAVARALDRQELAETVLKPLGLPARPVGSHLALAGQHAYADSSGALGGQDTAEALALLADAGWTRGGARPVATPTDGTKAGSKPSASRSASAPARRSAPASAAAGASASAAAAGKAAAESDRASDEGMYIVGDDRPGDDRPGVGGPGPEGTYVLAPAPGAAVQSMALARQASALGRADTSGKNDGDDQPKAKGGVPGAYAPRGTAAPGPGSGAASAPAPAAGPVGKDGKQLTLRFVLPSGSGSESLRAVGDKIGRMLDRVGIRTEITKVSDDSYFKDHIAAGDYDLALYSWPVSAYPATDGRPIFAKPQPATDGSLLVEQNYTRVGTDHIDQLFDQAAGELDEAAARELMKQADARIWAAAGSIPLYQRPQLVAAKPSVVNAGAFGFATPRHENIGFRKPSAGGRNASSSPSVPDSRD
ncbi:ABC transporter family substrate-binding protein [Streptomyces sp. SP18CS02]|uniref:ABC transporter family substrate-binding protein n=1 Tax=Streptomyces sp. SP18CS02 TaxID=3002531 RepID=UPI002E75B299|nr:ABC transporter family substrate-binding protein [Streptomyces sp. SP18CS02]MEE1756363.1 ABC transporter family substrate-binding protein [Streptomyces sp. SP18CS02]